MFFRAERMGWHSIKQISPLLLVEMKVLDTVIGESLHSNVDCTNVRFRSVDQKKKKIFPEQGFTHFLAQCLEGILTSMSKQRESRNDGRERQENLEGFFLIWPNTAPDDSEQSLHTQQR